MASAAAVTSRVDVAADTLDAAADRMRTARKQLRAVQPIHLPPAGELPDTVSLRVLSDLSDIIMVIDRSQYARVVVSLERVHSVGPALVFRTIDRGDVHAHDPRARRVCFFRLGELPDLADAVTEALRRTASMYEAAHG